MAPRGGGRDEADRLGDLVYERYGLSLSASKLQHVRNKAAILVSRGHYGDVEEFLGLAASGAEGPLDDLIAIITTGHTFFFRERDHIDYLADSIARSRVQSPAIWCAACSTGEEAYSIAITLAERGMRDFRIVATDLNRDTLRRFNEGLYNKGKLVEVPEAILKKYFKPAGQETYKIAPTLRSFVSIKRLNLMDPIRFEYRFDYAFCRNVLMYFDEGTRKKALENIVANVKHGGLLFFGHAEPLLDPLLEMERIGPAVYRRS